MHGAKTEKIAKTPTASVGMETQNHCPTYQRVDGMNEALAFTSETLRPSLDRVLPKALYPVTTATMPDRISLMRKGWVGLTHP